VVPADAAYRPKRRTRKPEVSSLLSAVVVGPAGEEVYTDEHGRVKVQFHFDRLGKKDEKSSCWVRVASPWAGQGFGAAFLPRIGHEVLVAFQDGDPDRPIIVGSAYHATNRTPMALPLHKTQSAIKTKSVGGDGSNELRFEDKAGAEEVFMHAERNYREIVGNDHSSTVKHNRSADVLGDDKENVDGEQVITIKRSQETRIRGSHRVVIEGAEEQGGHRGSAIAICGKYKVDASETIHMQAPERFVLTVGGSTFVMEPGRIKLVAGDGASLELSSEVLAAATDGAAMKLNADVLMHSSAGSEVKLDGDAQMHSSAGSEVKLDANAHMAATGGGAVSLDANATMSSGAEATVIGALAALVGNAEAFMAGGGGSAVAANGGGVSAAGGKVDIGGGAVNVVGGAIKLN
jgi:type VI secretion system secreted protein VgrG